MNTLSRRGFLGAGAGALAFAAVPLSGPAGAQSAGPPGSLVVVHLMGGVDGLAVLVPDGDDGLRSVRPTIGIAPAGSAGGAIPFVAGWGLHPALAPLMQTAGSALAVVGGAGFAERPPVRSHARGLRLLRRGHDQRGRTGWGTKVLDESELPWTSAAWWGSSPSGILGGLPGVGPRPGVDPLSSFENAAAARRALEVAFAGSSFETAASVALAGPRVHSTGADAAERGYPATPVGQRLAAAADWVRADEAPRIVVLEVDGFDTHRAQGNGTGGVLAARLDEVSRSLARFWAEVAPVRSGVTVAVVSEFGRAIGENRIGGTNHGGGGVALVLDETVVPGLHGDPEWPAAGGRRDRWPVTTDTREVLAAALRRRGLVVDDDIFGDDFAESGDDGLALF